MTPKTVYSNLGPLTKYGFLSPLSKVSKGQASDNLTVYIVSVVSLCIKSFLHYVRKLVLLLLCVFF